MDYAGCGYEAARPLPSLPKSLIAWETAFTRSITFVVCWYSLFCKNSHLFLVLLLDPLALLLMEFVWMPSPYLQSVHSAKSFKVIVHNARSFKVIVHSVKLLSHLLSDPPSHHLCFAFPHVLIAEKATNGIFTSSRQATMDPPSKPWNGMSSGSMLHLYIKRLSPFTNESKVEKVKEWTLCQKAACKAPSASCSPLHQSLHQPPPPSPRTRMTMVQGVF